jgi:hypothetical protein
MVVKAAPDLQQSMQLQERGWLCCTNWEHQAPQAVQHDKMDPAVSTHTVPPVLSKGEAESQPAEMWML